MSEAILFPGQGAQFPGMGKDWAEAHAVARETFEQADDVLGFSLSRACWAEAEEVNGTDIAQPGIFTTSVAIVRTLRSLGQAPESIPLTAGLSLGEYSALWLAGALSFEDGLRLVRLRGEAMQEAAEAIPSGMASLVGADLEKAEALAQVGSQEGICQVANVNAPGQIILSGELVALDAVESVAKEHGVRRVRRLVVAGGFHSECMRPAADRLETALAQTVIAPPQVPVISNVDGGWASEPDQIRSNLARQVCSPVLWEQSMRLALDQGVRQFLEPGPGTVLGGLMRKIDPQAVVRSTATPADLASGTQA
jgi:[acyl-carrier-protein] S-malonyltransferase